MYYFSDPLSTAWYTFSHDINLFDTHARTHTCPYYSTMELVRNRSGIQNYNTWKHFWNTNFVLNSADVMTVTKDEPNFSVEQVVCLTDSLTNLQVRHGSTKFSQQFGDASCRQTVGPPLLPHCAATLFTVCRTRNIHFSASLQYFFPRTAIMDIVRYRSMLFYLLQSSAQPSNNDADDQN